MNDFEKWWLKVNETRPADATPLTDDDRVHVRHSAHAGWQACKTNDKQRILMLLWETVRDFTEADNLSLQLVRLSRLSMLNITTIILFSDHDLNFVNYVSSLIRYLIDVHWRKES